MEVKVYREKVQEKVGYYSHKGEDGKPYVGKKAIMVADGLGGSAAIRHIKFERGLFHEDELMDTLFKGVYEDYSNEEFVKYVKESFADFYAMDEEAYFKDILSMKKGGYFGSRIVTAIALYEFLRQGEGLWLEGDTVWDKIHGAKTVEELKEVQTLIGEYFAQTISEKLEQISKNANLIYESPMKGLALLGTTLCATLYNECDGYVEAVYLEAGDSRPYMIDENGMAQVVADQEGADGAMSNCIKANGEFGIHCEYRRFKTPCILFNASDGCFDSYAFPTQLNFEKLVLDCIAGNDTEGRTNALTDEEWEALRASDKVEDQEKRISEQLRGFFEDNGRHDDSSTIAMKSFGFNSFEEVQAFAKARLQKIEEQYTKGNNEIIRYDYADEEQRLDAEITRGLTEKRAPLWNNYDSVKTYCKTTVTQEGVSEDYAAALAEKESKTAECEAAWESAVNEAAEKIDRYYLAIIAEKSQEDMDKVAWKKWGECLDEKAKARRIIEGIREDATKYQEKLEAATQALTDMLAEAKGKSFDDYVVKIDEEKRKIFQLQSDIKDLLEGLEKGKGEKNKKIANCLKKFFKLNKDATKKNEEKLIALASDLVNLREEVEKAVFIKADCEEIIAIIDKMDGLKEQMTAIETEFQTKWDEAATAYWKANFKDVMEKIANAEEDEEPKVSPEDKEAIQIIFLNTEKKKKMSDGIAEQKEIFAAYEEEYERVMKAELELSEEGKAKAEEEAKKAEEEAVEESVEEIPAEETNEAPEETSEEEAVEETEEEVVEETVEETAEETFEDMPEEFEDTTVVEETAETKEDEADDTSDDE